MNKYAIVTASSFMGYLTVILIGGLVLRQNPDHVQLTAMSVMLCALIVNCCMQLYDKRKK